MPSVSCMVGAICVSGAISPATRQISPVKAPMRWTVFIYGACRLECLQR